jgi:hypothetical protein
MQTIECDDIPDIFGILYNNIYIYYLDTGIAILIIQKYRYTMSVFLLRQTCLQSRLERKLILTDGRFCSCKQF